MIIGIEGPAGAGKSTMAQRVAPEIGAVVIEGGAWYRALTYAAQIHDVDFEDTTRLVDLVRAVSLKIIPAADKSAQVIIDGHDVTKQAYGDVVSTNVPIIAKQLPVRDVLDTEIQSTVRSYEKVITVGRHIRRAFPEARILRLTIDETEADRRHQIRAGESAVSVGTRNKTDAEISQTLAIDSSGDLLLDVSHLSLDQQAQALRDFINKA